MTDLRDRYLACWNETDAAARQALLAQSWSADARYVDPLAEVHGLAELDALIAGAQQQFAGFVFTPVGDVDAHHELARFSWGLGPAGAEPVIVGFDVLELDPDGRIVHVRGFLDRVPS